jgi:signal transduction histidine kinase
VDPNAGKPRSERDDTDKSLRTERKKTDAALGENRARTENAADGVLEHARDQADAVLGEARDKADDKLDAAEAGPRARAAVTRERAGEDKAIDDERAAADASLHREREDRARTLAELLPLERQKTDRYLLTERVRSDTAIGYRDDFMGIIAHELRNLLHGIAGTSRMLSKHAAKPDEEEKIVAASDRIERHVARMNRLIGDLHDMVSIEAGKFALYPEPGDAAALIAESVETFSDAAEQKGITLAVEISEQPLPAVFDRERILQVVCNLIANAIKFTPEGGVVTLSGERAADHIHLAVRDTGTGIPDDMLEAVFERFRQVSTNDHRGLGLGLYICKCLVEAHGGRIWAESTMGASSVFHFTFPVTARANP